MKKKVVIIACVVLLAAIGIFLVARYFPKPQGDQGAGTVGKADKFRKGQFTAEDIILRDDILKDTAAVGRTLDQVCAFGVFMQQEKLIIDSLWIKEINKNCPSYQGCKGCDNCRKATQILAEYSTYLANNMNTVKSTCEVLLSAYNGKQKDLSGDVGFKLLTFIQVVDEMIQRDSVLTTAVKLVDDFINSKDNMSDKKRQAQMARMKQVRDHMVIDNLLFAAKTGDRKQSEIASSFALSSTGNDLSAVLSGSDQYVGSKPLGTSEALAVEQLNSYYDALGLSVLNTNSLGLYSSDRLNSIILGNLYLSANDMNVVVLNMPVINSALGLSNFIASNQLQSNPALNTVLNSVLLQSQALYIVVPSAGTVFNSNNLNLILSNDNR